MASTTLTEAELASLLEAGLLSEDHHRDLKRELPTHPRVNQDFARDLAAFAVDGGTIYIGVKEHDATGPAALNPVPLRGLKERVDQIARQTPRPPVAVRCDEVRSEENPDLGYLVVTIPPSPDAPHMVDGRYIGRGDTTNHVLQDHEVVRLHNRRGDAATDIRELLDAERLRDPSPVGFKQAHLYVVAQPQHHDDELLVGAIDKPLSDWAREHVLNGPPGQRGYWEPDIGTSANQISSRAGAVAVHTNDVRPGREIEPQTREYGVLDLEVREDGGIRLFCSRGSDDRHGERVVIMSLLWGLTKRVALTAAEVSKSAGFLGAWSFGVLLEPVHGVTPLEHEMRLIGTYPRYSESTYERTAVRTTEDVREETNALVDALWSRLGRSLRYTFTADDLPF